jgi:hypothetical protein
MTDAYSLFLGIAVSVLALSWGLLLASRWWPATRRVSMLAASIAMVFDAASLVVHLVAGHPPGSPDAMTFGRFFAEHPAFLIVLLASAVAVAVGVTTTRHARRVA